MNKKNGAIIKRVLLDALIALFVINGWWFIALPLALFGAWRFSYFVEMVIFGAFYDALFGLVPEIGWRGYIGIITTGAAMVLMYILKKIVRR